MPNDETQISWRAPGFRVLGFVIYFAHSSKSLKRSDAIPALPSTTFVLRILVLERPEPPSAENALSRAPLSCTCRYTSKTLSSRPNRQLQHNSPQRLLPLRPIG